VARRGRILVAAGTNGAGKSSIVGRYLEAAGSAYFDPDVFARQLLQRGLSQEDANARSWTFGFEALCFAIDRNEDFAFETTLGGSSIVRELRRAAAMRREVHVFYVGLASVEQHIARVQARVERGGHDIPEARIRERYVKSLANLISLVGVVTELHVFDNSEEAADGLPHARLLFRMRRRRIVEPPIEALLRETPYWAKPVVAAALDVHARRARTSAKAPSRKSR
jgi:predicted ABC-type ATPase